LIDFKVPNAKQLKIEIRICIDRGCHNIYVHIHIT
jgi:hypothetical protein